MKTVGKNSPKRQNKFSIFAIYSGVSPKKQNKQKGRFIQIPKLGFSCDIPTRIKFKIYMNMGINVNDYKQLNNKIM